MKKDFTNKYNKNFSDEKKQISQKSFLKKFFEKEQFDYDKNFHYFSKINKNSSVKNIFALKDIIQNKVKFILILFYFIKYISFALPKVNLS